MSTRVTGAGMGKCIMPRLIHGTCSSSSSLYAIPLRNVVTTSAKRFIYVSPMLSPVQAGDVRELTPFHDQERGDGRAAPFIREILLGQASQEYVANRNTRMPPLVRHDLTSSAQVWIVYEQPPGYVCSCSDGCWPWLQTIAYGIGCSRHTMIQPLNELYERGSVKEWRRELDEANASSPPSGERVGGCDE